MSSFYLTWIQLLLINPIRAQKNLLKSGHRCAVNGNWGMWGTWSTCMCNTKTHNRFRECNNPVPARGGANCVGVRYEESSCADQCPGTWLDWEPWSPCTATCNGGNQVRQRQCSQPDTTIDCLGSRNEMQACGTMSCQATTSVQATVLTTTPSTTTTEGPGAWVEWTEWSTCSTSCGSGFRYIARFCIDPHTEKEKHDCLGQTVDSESCEVMPCAVDGSWSEWNGWGQCHRGLQSRSRECNNPGPLYNGTNCQGSNVDITNCTETTTAPHEKLVPPEIFGHTEADVGGNVTLLCLTSIPGLTVTWYYLELIITGVDSKNYGKYTCVLSDSNNTVKNQVFINLHECTYPTVLYYV
ncbi:hypothetical protein CHS0354_001744 [Potamilus streckersoni]|uniref:Ig-like domain-containing protein n=1 Tax=Potamilus streckersoni TaxID=2493646 RepID=A0AAE0W501_9BIVA|nr:hypothetical protein CHS0354_001744 [Potamilus streckersoni]